MSHNLAASCQAQHVSALLTPGSCVRWPDPATTTVLGLPQPLAPSEGTHHGPKEPIGHTTALRLETLLKTGAMENCPPRQTRTSINVRKAFHVNTVSVILFSKQYTLEKTSTYLDTEVVCKSLRSLVYFLYKGQWHCPWSGTEPADPACRCHS